MIKLRKLLAACFLLLSPLAQANTTIDGLLEVGTFDSVVYMVDPESDFLNAFYFSNHSTAGKKTLSYCIDGINCQIEQATFAKRDQVPDGLFSGVVDVFEILDLGDAYMKSMDFGYDNSKVFTSEFGTLRINPEGQLFFRGKRVLPISDGIWVDRIVADIADSDHHMVLMSQFGGSACPALFYFARLDYDGIQIGNQFGTCTDIINFQMSPEDDFQIVMPGFLGPLELEQDRRRAGLTKHTFHLMNDGNVIRVQ